MCSFFFSLATLHHTPIIHLTRLGTLLLHTLQRLTYCKRQPRYNGSRYDSRQCALISMNGLSMNGQGIVLYNQIHTHIRTHSLQIHTHTFMFSVLYTIHISADQYLMQPKRQCNAITIYTLDCSAIKRHSQSVLSSPINPNKPRRRIIINSRGFMSSWNRPLECLPQSSR